MKKIIMVLTGSLLLLLVVSLIVSYNKTVDNKYFYYTIPKNYALYDDSQRLMSVDVYTEENNSIISFIEKNKYKIRVNNNDYIINDINVVKKKDYFENSRIYIYSFSFPISCIPYEVDKESCELIINNKEFKLILKLGFISIYRGDYELLDFIDLYGNYSQINDELHLVGITLAFGKGYNELNKITSGVCYGRIEKIKRDAILNSEIDSKDIETDIIGESNVNYSYILNNNNRYYFIPIGYNRLLLNLNPCFIFEIDGKEYLLDNFYYLINNISLSEYKSSKKAGEIIYA